jgi:hypothetical protein
MRGILLFLSGSCLETEVRLFQNFSFGTATLDLKEKAGFRPLFPGACGKTIGFWNRLKFLNNSIVFSRSLGYVQY